MEHLITTRGQNAKMFNIQAWNEKRINMEGDKGLSVTHQSSKVLENIGKIDEH
jgi:hypothetical protein